MEILEIPDIGDSNGVIAKRKYLYCSAFIIFLQKQPPEFCKKRCC